MGLDRKKPRSWKEVQDSDRDVHLISYNRGKEPIIPDDVNTPANDELSSGNSPSLILSLTKNARESKAKSHKRPSHHPTSTMSLVAHLTRQGEKQARGRTSQFRPLGTR